ncbi:MAG: hypothetical protein ACLFO1_09355, partial [Spirochaetaceae bacterium]
MTTDEHQKLHRTISEIETALASETDLHTVILYGSGAQGRLRGPGELESDVDVAVAAEAEARVCGGEGTGNVRLR